MRSLIIALLLALTLSVSAQAAIYQDGRTTSLVRIHLPGFAAHVGLQIDLDLA